MSSINEDMDAAVSELSSAIQCLEIESTRVRQARLAETSAINRVNNVQKRIDELVSCLKNSAPYNTDWYNRTSKGEKA